MTKAQEVRQRRLDSIQADRDEALKVFEWLLDVLDKRTAKKDYSPLEVSFDGYYIRPADHDSYNVHDCGMKAIYDYVKDMFNNEEGYSAVSLEPTGRDRCFNLRIVIE